MDWEPIIWAVIWIVVGLIALGIIAWIVVAAIGASAFKRVSKSITSETEDPFDAPFFKHHSRF